MNMISILFPPPKPNLQKLKVKLQNLLGPNDMDNRNNGVKSKSVVIPIVKSSGILDTFSLSFVGNLNFSNAIQGLQKIVEGLASCEFRAELGPLKIAPQFESFFKMSRTQNYIYRPPGKFMDNAAELHESRVVPRLAWRQPIEKGPQTFLDDGISHVKRKQK